MSEAIILADASLVRNHEFREGFTYWNKGPINPGWVDRKIVQHEGQDIYCVVVGNQGSVSQIIDVPKTASAEVRYSLTFLYESWHDAAGRLEISIEGGTAAPQIITIPAGQLLGGENRIDWQRAVFTPVEVNLTLPLTRLDKVRVSVFSPASQDNEYEKVIRVTRIKVLLYLEPLILQQLQIDDQILPPTRQLYLCLGASGSFQHRLGVVPAAGNTWLDTHASLNIEKNPQDAIVATPTLGTDHPLDSEWELDCPLVEGSPPHELSLVLRNKFTAKPYVIKAALGHFRLAFGDILEPAYYPVLEYGQSVRLGVQVVSFYTGQWFAGVSVTWVVNGQKLAAPALTEDYGWAYFDYVPTVAGESVIEAQVESEYFASGVHTQQFTVLVLATDPLKELMAVVGSSAAPWDEKTGYPNRGTQYPLTVRLPATSPLLGTELKLLWEDGDPPDELGVTVIPKLAEFVPMTTVEKSWIMDCGDILDAKFKLRFGCSKLLLDSSKKNMSLARNLVEIGEVIGPDKSPVVDEKESVLLRLQVVHRVASGEGDPVVNALVDWVGPDGTVSTITGAGGWASVYDTPRAPGPYVITAQVRAHADMSPVECPFEVLALATSQWKDRALYYLDDKPVDRIIIGAVCLRGKSHTFRVEPTPNSPIKDKPISLIFHPEVPGMGLAIAAPTITPDGGRSWVLSSSFSTSFSSLFNLSLSSEALPGSTRVVPGRLLSENLTEEGLIMLDQVSGEVGSKTFSPCLGARHRFSFQANVRTKNPLIGLRLMLRWSGASAEDLGAEIQPQLDRSQVIDAGGAAWWLNFASSQKVGEFGLAVELPQLGIKSAVNLMQLGHNKVRIGTLHESAIDPIVGQDRAWQWAQVNSAFTGEPVFEVPVKWTAQGASTDVPTNASGWSGFGLLPANAQEHVVEASVTSAYDGYKDKRTMKVKALADDPWKDLMVSIDLQPPRKWGGTFFPRRNRHHMLEFSVPPGSELDGQFVRLAWHGNGPSALAINTSALALGVPRYLSSAGLIYKLECGDEQDGSFAWSLAASRLLSRSPAAAMSLGASLQALKIIATTAPQPNLEWEQEFEAQVKVVCSISDRPLPGVRVTWQSRDLGEVVTMTNFYGVARVRFTPVTVGAGMLTAMAGDIACSEFAFLPFHLGEPLEIAELVETGRSVHGLDQAVESRAQAKVISSRTGAPQEGVQVMWGYSSRTLPVSTTDRNGIAKLTFSRLAESEGVLTATVKGGVAGWQTADLVYGGGVPVIDSLTSSKEEVFLGSATNARVKVISLSDGLPLTGIRVRWEFPGLRLPPTVTKINGESTITFVPPSLGSHTLKAVVGFDNAKSLDFKIIEGAKVIGMELSSSLMQLCETMTARALVEKFAQGAEVEWSCTGLGISRSSINADGWTTMSFSPPTSPFYPLIEVIATVGADTGHVSRQSRKFWLFKDANSIKPILWVNKIPISLPISFPAKIKQNNEIEIAITRDIPQMAHEFAIFSAHPQITLTPPEGEYRKGADSTLAWRVSIQAPVGEEFAIVVASRDMTFRTGVRCIVIAPTLGSDRDEIIDPDVN